MYPRIDFIYHIQNRSIHLQSKEKIRAQLRTGDEGVLWAIGEGGRSEPFSLLYLCIHTSLYNTSPFECDFICYPDRSDKNFSQMDVGDSMLPISGTVQP